ncbi:MAG: lysophospholipid acyltransferase family protein [Candidatus Tectimicrobiota bacterium]
MNALWHRGRRPWRLVIAPRLTAWGVRLLTLTLRPVYVHQHWEQGAWESGAPVLLAAWHGRVLYLLRRYYRQRRQFTVLVSRSRDGEFISRVLQCCSIRTIRGSSSRGGMRAGLELIRSLRQGSHALIVPDGPRGPRYQVQPGIILVAEKTGALIVPVTYNARWKKVLTSWDRFIIPLPFSRVVVIYGEPLQIAAPLTSERLQAAQQQLASVLQAITAQAEAYFTP